MSTVLWSLSLTATIWTLKDDNIHFFWQMCKYINEEYHFFLETNPLIFIPLAVSKVEHISSFKLFKHLYLYYTFSKKIYVCNHVSIQINHKKFFVLREKHHCQNSQSFRINYTIFDTPYSTRYSEFFYHTQSPHIGTRLQHLSISGDFCRKEYWDNDIKKLFKWAIYLLPMRFIKHSL